MNEPNFDSVLDREIAANEPRENPECDTCEDLLGAGGCSAPSADCDTCGTETATLVNCQTTHYCSARCARAGEC